mgnify:CR=1 FL=1|jgi:nitrogen fixation protein
MPESKNTFLKGRMNQDLDSRILPEGEYREAINLMISRSEGSTVGEFENVLGNTSISTISSTKNKSVIGHVIDQTNNIVYLFATTFSDASEFSRAGDTEECSIIQVNLNNPQPPTVLVDGYWLNFNKKFPIHAANILEDFIFWTDNFNQPRRISISRAIADPQAYTEEMQISVAKYYPFRPVIPMERQTVLTDTTGNTSTLIKIATGNDKIKVGDIVTPNDKTNVASMPIRNVRPPVRVVEIMDPTAAGGPTEFKVSPAIITNPNNNPPTTGPIPANTKIDFSRTSMHNRSEEYLSNYSIQEVSATGITSTSFEVHADANNNISALFQGVPRVGDIITIVGPSNNINNIPNSNATQTAAYRYDVRITKVTMNMSNSGATLYIPEPDIRFMVIEVDKDMTAGGNLTGLTAGDKILIASNPDFERNFPGDTNFLDDKFVRFSYRFKFEDNEYSLMAPFSKIMFIPKQFGQFNLGQIDTEIPGFAGEKYGIKNYYQDETDAYSSTILEWFENDVDSIGLKIPLPGNITELQTKYKISKIDILYKESDALAVKVLETVNLSTPNLSTETINYNDDTHGLLDQVYFDYVYKSNKPYKTLPQNQTTRVYDKVPIKALGQEIISNRIVYGNFLERMTPPESIDYSASTTNTDVETSDYAIQYPFQTTKQNRIYQIGFVLADYYGRQSDVILSSNDSINDVTGSTVTIPYRDANDAITEPVFDWMGSNLALTINESIAADINNTAGKPGLYREEGYAREASLTAAGTDYEENVTYATTYVNPLSGSGKGLTIRVTGINALTGEITDFTIITAGGGYEDNEELTVVGGNNDAIIQIGKTGAANPLGWYTYKIVVKQQQQEYYNVYIPGFVNGLPINNQLWNKVTLVGSAGFTPIQTERGKIFFSTVLSDNINKIPRNLTEVGPTDQEFNSDEQLFIRVNNPNPFNLNTTTTTTPGANYYIFAENQQYYPAGSIQNVLTMSTVKENELAAVPFQKFRIAPVVTGTTNPTEATQEFPLGGFTSGDQGQYGLTTRYVPSGTNQVVTTERGSIPWGDVGSVASFYGADQNPFIMKVGQPGNFDNPIGAIVIDESEYGNQYHDTNFEEEVVASSGGNPGFTTYSRKMSMRPKLTVAETKPVESLLEIFWETCMTGKLEVLNSMIETNYNGAIGVNNNVGTFSEDQGLNTNAGNQIKFINGSGSEITTIQDISITAVYRSSAPSTAIFNPDGTLPFDIDLVGNAPANEVQITTNSLFWYGDNSYQNDVYIFDLQVTSGNSSEYVDDLSNIYTLSLNNDTPIIFDDTGAALGDGDTVALSGSDNPSVDDVFIYQFSGKNGSADTSNDTQQLSFSIQNFTENGSPQTGNIPFAVDNTGRVTSTATMVNEATYILTVQLADANNSNNSQVDVQTTSVFLQFTAGTLYAPKVIGTGQATGASQYSIFSVPSPNATTQPTNGSGFWGFVQGDTANANSNFTQTGSTYLPSGVSGAAILVPPQNIFNIRTIYNTINGTNCRGDLFQGTILIKPTWEIIGQGGPGAQLTSVGKWVIQHRPIDSTLAPSGPWAEINSAAGSVNTYSANQGGVSGPGLGDFDLTDPVGTKFSYSFKFDQLGQYRVVYNNFGSVNSSPRGYAIFYIEFFDGTYGQQLMTVGPCTP